jgi:hypothetical protein
VQGRACLVGQTLTVPINKGRFDLGIWQGVYVCVWGEEGGDLHAQHKRPHYAYICVMCSEIAPHSLKVGKWRYWLLCK